MSSSALASARKRRSGPETVATPPPSQFGRPGFNPGAPSTSSASPQGGGLTIQQVVAVVDKRLLILESFMNDQKNINSTINSSTVNATNTNQTAESAAAIDIPTNIKELLEEYNNRFDIIADELASIKNMMLSLQSFTMDVNKKLMDERIRILSSEDTVPESNIFTGLSASFNSGSSFENQLSLEQPHQ